MEANEEEEEEEDNGVRHRRGGGRRQRLRRRRETTRRRSLGRRKDVVVCRVSPCGAASFRSPAPINYYYYFYFFGGGGWGPETGLTARRNSVGQRHAALMNCKAVVSGYAGC